VNIQTIIENAGDFWRIRVLDQGRGIPDQVKATVFERYSGSSKGSGLGLSIVRALAIDRYRGSIKIRDRVEGDYSKGTSIEVLLPKFVNANSASA